MLMNPNGFHISPLYYNGPLMMLARWLVMVALAATPLLADLEGYLRAEMELNHIPGLALAVVRDGRLAYTRAFGVRSLATGEPMTDQTPVELASVSKSFTALAVLDLERQGRLDLDLPVATYLPEFGAGAGDDRSRITVRHLLGHTSGLSRRRDSLMACCGDGGEFDLPVALRKLATSRPVRPPGARFAYANSNYVLLAALVERLGALPFPEYLRRRVFDPLGLTRTTLDPAEARSWGLSESHEWQWGRVRISPSHYKGWYGASLVKSSAADMGRYLAAWLAGGPAPLPAAGWWNRPEPRRYEAGWFLRPRADWLDRALALEHGGDIWGGNTAVVFAPQLRAGVVVLLNVGTDRAGPIAHAALRQVAGLSLPPPAVSGSEIPDYWAIRFTAAAGLLLAGLALYLLRVLSQFRRRQRRFAPARPAILRAVVLVLLAAYLLFLMAGPVPLEIFPTTMKVALPLLASSVAALLLAAAAVGLAPRR